MRRSLFSRGAIVVFSAAFFAACGDTPTSPAVSDAAVPAFDLIAGPTLIAGNPTCTDNLFIGGYKFDNQPRGTLSYDTELGTITFTTSEDGTSITSWTSDFPIDGVFMKGGPQGNLYIYDGDMSGGGEVTPTNNSSTPAGISHIDFCWYGRFDVEVDAVTSFDRDHDWTIAKTAVGPESVSQGSKAAVDYTVSVDETTTDSNWMISGNVTVTNSGWGEPGFLVGVNVSASNGETVPADCGFAVPGPVFDGSSVVCSYSMPVSDGSARDVTASVDALPPFTGSSSAPVGVVFDIPTNETDEEISVTDTRTTLTPGTATVDTTWSYTLDFDPYDACVPVTIDNTAGFTTNDTGTTGSASASVTFNVTGCSSDWEELGTAFAFGDGASTFTSLDSGIKRWGWSLSIDGPGSYTYDVYAGAGQNDLTKGTLVGTVTIDYSGTSVTATYDLDAGYVLAEEHLYAGDKSLPQARRGKKTVNTVAPGQYSVSGDLSGGAIWVIAHSVIGYIQP